MTNKTNIDTGILNEVALEGVSHLLTKNDWFQLIPNRMRGESLPLPLSAEFIREHKNDMNLAKLTLWVARMCDIPEMRKQFDMDFCKQFWRFICVDGGNASQLAFQKSVRDNNTNWFMDEIASKLYPKNVASILLDCFDKPNHKKWKDLPSCADYEKNPYYYDSVQLRFIVGLNKEVPNEFLERFVHLVNFNNIFENSKLSLERKHEIIERFSVPIKGTNKVLFPCGTVVDTSSAYFQIREQGEAFLDNVCRYVDDANEESIKAIVAKFPRAVKDCLDPENALAMQSK